MDVDTGTPVTTIEAWEKATQWNKVALVPVTITRDKIPVPRWVALSVYSMIYNLDTPS